MDASQNVNIQVFNLDSLRKLLATYCNNKANTGFSNRHSRNVSFDSA